MKRFLCLISLFMMGITTTAFARSIYEENDFYAYISAKGGYSRGIANIRIGNDPAKDIKTDNLAFNGALGVQSRYLRWELEYGYLGSDPDSVKFGAAEFKTKVRIKTYQINGYIDFFRRSVVRPYLGIGIGAADVEIKYDNSEDLKERTLTRLAANANAGFGIRLSPSMWMDIGYKFLIINKIKMKETVAAVKYTDRREHLFHEATLGFRLMF